MRKQLGQAMQGVTLVALVAAGFTLGVRFMDVHTYAASAHSEERSCVLPAAFNSENARGGGGADARAFIAFLQMCHP